MHPCFNSGYAVHIGEQEEREGEIVTTYAVKMRGYLQPTVFQGRAIRGQPVPQPYFCRPLHVLFGAAFAAGFVLDALEEPAFPPDHPEGRYPLSWGRNYWQIPPVLVARMRLLGE